MARLRRLHDVPIPRDSGHGTVAGRDPLRVAFIGDAAAVGYGTVSQQLGVAAHYARLLSRRDHRGVNWVTAHFPKFTMHRATELTSHAAFWNDLDRVVVIAGIGDAVSLMPVGTWTRSLDEMLTTMRSRLPAAATITVAEIPPLELSSSIPPCVRRLISAHIDDLNRATRTVVDRHQRARTVILSEKRVIDLSEACDTGVSGLYLAWARALLAVDSSGVNGQGESA
ncbi:hypothetical protein ACFDTO_07505 [Microbacteriaceae bacterium 4G12]